jgi:hypothetical protein
VATLVTPGTGSQNRSQAPEGSEMVGEIKVEKDDVSYGGDVDDGIVTVGGTYGLKNETEGGREESSS